MQELLAKIESDYQILRKAIANSDEDRINSTSDSLRRRLLSSEIGSERILGNVLQLLSEIYGEEAKDNLNSLFQQLEIIKDINDKFYAIINHEVGLDELLITKLISWKCLDVELRCEFSQEDKEKLKEARSQGNAEQKIRAFTSIYFNCVKEHIQDIDLSKLETKIKLVIENLKWLSQWKTQALFSIDKDGDVYGIKVKPSNGGNGNIKALVEVGVDMKTAANSCFEFVKNKYQIAKTWDITWEIEKGDISYEGYSIGLALTLGILASIQVFEIDPYTAFTGKIEWDTGKVQPVGELDTKLSAAKAKGIRRVFIPAGNTGDYSSISDLDIIPVGSVEEAKTILNEKSYVSASSTLEQQAEMKLKELELKLIDKGIKTLQGIQDRERCKRVVLTDHSDEIFVDAYYGKTGIKLTVQQKNSPLRDVILAACEQVPDSTDHKTTNLIERDKYMVSDKDTQKGIESYIFGLPFATRETEQNCLYRARLSKNGLTTYVRQFNKGTLTIDGQSPLFSEINIGIRAILGLSASKFSGSLNGDKLEKQIEAVKAVDLGNQWIGTDEAGKGDYFGPLVGAAVLIDHSLADRLSKIGVKDSKQLSDNRNIELASKIINICGKRAQVVLIPPTRYNQLYREFTQEGKNLNTLLAWVHTRALDDILSAFPQDQVTVIIDKFADEQYIIDKLLENARRTKLHLVQLPKAEANIAVAAASILARAQFLNWLERTSQQLNLALPKGSSNPKIPQIARQIIEKYGQEKLAEIAKLHFKTTKDILR